MNGEYKITTKKGDKGFTCLWAEEILSKSDGRIELLGLIDELIAFIGIAKYKCYGGLDHTLLDLIQKDLSQAAGEVVGIKGSKIINDHVKFLDRTCEALDSRVKIPKGWWFGGTEPATYVNYCRVLTRKCERKVVELLQKRDLKNKILIKYFNRLSDVLYLLTLEMDKQ